MFIPQLINFGADVQQIIPRCPPCLTTSLQRYRCQSVLPSYAQRNMRNSDNSRRLGHFSLCLSRNRRRQVASQEDQHRMCPSYILVSDRKPSKNSNI